MQASQLIQNAEKLHRAGRIQESAEYYRMAIQLMPEDPELHYELGNLCLELGQHDQAIGGYQSALKYAPGHPQVLLQIGNTYSAMGQPAEAVRFFRESIQADPSGIAAHFNLGNALRELGQPGQAAACYHNVLRLDPDDADAHNNLGNALRELGRLDEAIACYERALEINPALHYAKAHLVHQKQHICDWRGLEKDINDIRNLVAGQPHAQISPFAFIAMPGTTAAEQKRCADNWVANRYAKIIEHTKQPGFSYRHEGSPAKLRIGYLSGDFRLHPLAFLITELIELHDRSNFGIYAYSYAVDDQTPERKRLEQAFDRFVDIRPLSQPDAARKINSDHIDILVDLTGFTQNSRSAIAAMRPTPINVSWLGFPGTMGSMHGKPLFDYLLSDHFITPEIEARHYAEKLALLPHCYQPNDRRRPVGKTPTRESCGLPEEAFVFCCFNQSFKITPQIFAIWMRLLKAAPGSILWLLDCNRWAKGNLCREAETLGINADRLVFAPRAPIADHLARHILADLFLDTLPYNAHTTTSDALWMGLPIVTCTGNTFASRVAGSLLKAANLPELVADSLEEYETLAMRLASRPHELSIIKRKIKEGRSTMPLFDTTGFARQLEQAYRLMWQAYSGNKPPQPVTVMLK